MQLFTRDTSLTSLASALSLVIANYKPIPQLPTNASSSSSTINNGSTTAKQLVSMGGSTSQQTFMTQSTNSSNVKPTSEWGEPSVLYVPQSASSSANTFKASGATLGPGNCPVQQAYTPNGGWSALPPPVFPAFDPVMANVYRYRQQQGVNLGAW